MVTTPATVSCLHTRDLAWMRRSWRACALLLAVHHAASLLDLVIEPTQGLPRDLTERVGGPVPWGHIMERLGPSFHGAVLTLTIVAALVLVFGRHGRICTTVLLCGSLEAYWAHYPLSRLDGYVVNVACLLLSTVPWKLVESSGRYRVSLGTYRGRGPIAIWIPGRLAAHACVLVAGVTWLNLALAFDAIVPSNDGLLRAGLCAVCALTWTSRGWFRTLLLGLAAVTYASFAVGSGCWLAAALMFCMQGAALAAVDTVDATEVQHSHFAAAPVSVAVCLLLAVVHSAALAAGFDGLAFRTGRALALVGLALPGAYAFHGLERSEIDLAWNSGSGERLRETVLSFKDETLAFCLQSTWPGSESLRQFAAEHFSRKVCSHTEAGPGELTLEHAGEPIARVWLTCTQGKVTTAFQLALAQ